MFKAWRILQAKSLIYQKYNRSDRLSSRGAHGTQEHKTAGNRA